jgi:predicted outer membrane repeat protein
MMWLFFLAVLLQLLWSGATSPPLNISTTNLTSGVQLGLEQANATLHINLLLDEYVLDSAVMFNDTLQAVSVKGMKGGSAIICPGRHTDAGLLFHGVLTVQLSNLRLHGCAAVWRYPYSNSRTLVIRSALHIITTQAVTLSNITIETSPGTGILLAYNNGTTYISDSKFLGNRLQLDRDNDEEVVFGGGGVYLWMSQVAPASSFLFTDCEFRDNIAANTGNYTYVFAAVSGAPVSGRGRGGGMFINLRGEVEINNITLLRCHFINNSAFLGSGLSVEVEDDHTRHNTIIVEESKFVENGCKGSSSRGVGSGGGVQLSFRTLNSNSHHNNLIKFQSVQFNSNCALLGGGLYFFSNQNADPDVDNQLVLENCTWTRNYARMGSAVDITSDIFERSGSGYRLVPTFRACTFTRNSISSHLSLGSGEQENFGSSTFYSSLYDIVFEQSVLFSQNTGTALHMVNAIANFIMSSARFEGNSGIQGGGVALIGTSAMLIGIHNYTFINNTATDQGGAIYSQLVDSHDFMVSRSCFLRYLPLGTEYLSIASIDWEANVHFEGNTAHSQHGNDIFATSLLPCQVVNVGGMERNYSVLDTNRIFQPPGVTFAASHVVGLSIATDGARFSEPSHELRVIPGEQYEHGVEVIDDLEHVIETTLIASFPSRRSSITLDASSYCLTNQIIQLNGQPHESDTLLLQVTSPRRIFSALQVMLLDCPPGFALLNGHCECDALSHMSLLRCDGHQLHSYLRAGFWAGYINTTDGVKLVSATCPLGFCNYNFSNFGMNSSLFEVALPRSRDTLEQAVCGVERSGVMCGQCNTGYVVHFHSPHFECEVEADDTCSLGWLFYLLSEIIPATVLFIVILVFNLNFTSGALNGFLLFSQLFDTLLIDAGGVIAFPAGVQHAIQAIQLFYGFFNLDFFYMRSLSFCIWSQASVLDIIAFKYVTIGYSVLLIVMVILVLKYCGARCLGKYYRPSLMRNSVIQGLSAFLVICYTQCIKVSFNLLYFGRIYLSSADTNASVSKRVWYNGELEFFEIRHLPYALPALAVLLTIGVVPPAILLTFPAVLRMMACLKVRDSVIGKCLAPYSKLKPFLDAFQGSFKDNYRYFAGLYFIYRWTAIFLYAVISTYSIFYAFLEVALIVILVLHTLCRPYRTTWHNILDTLIIADIAIINRLTAVHYYSSRVDTGVFRNTYISQTSVGQVILIYLPAVYLVSYLIVQVMRRTCCKDGVLWQRVSQKVSVMFQDGTELKETAESKPKEEEEQESEEYPDRLTEYVTTSIVSIQ